MSTESVTRVPRQDSIVLLSEVGMTDPFGIPEQPFGELCPRMSRESVKGPFAIGRNNLFCGNSTFAVMVDCSYSDACDPRRLVSMPPRPLCLQELRVLANIETIVSAVPRDCRVESFAHALALVALALQEYERAAVLSLLERSVPSLLVYPDGGLLVRLEGNNSWGASAFDRYSDNDRLLKPPLRVITLA